MPNIAGQVVPYSRDYKRKYEYLKGQLRKPVGQFLIEDRLGRRSLSRPGVVFGREVSLKITARKGTLDKLGRTLLTSLEGHS